MYSVVWLGDTNRRDELFLVEGRNGRRARHRVFGAVCAQVGNNSEEISRYERGSEGEGESHGHVPRGKRISIIL